MKKILITILVVIILIFAYSQYKDYQRFHPNNIDYKINETVDLDYYNQSVVYNYYDAVEALNGFVSMQWSANEIDVKSPEDDDRETQIAVNEYGKKLAKVKYYEAKLEQSKALKNKGFSNEDIKNYEAEGLTLQAYNDKLKAEKFRERLFSNLPEANLRNGQKSAFVYEIQKLLVNKGYKIELDGIFKNATINAIMDFEAKNNLFVDGQLDEMTLEALLK
ncbi:peptidoglycan-binding protein [Flaviramulus sp. BrNp1-15]|uniref:peptidoglycan-binding domain-containing protein n=1 Tax=Flaviramulus sp. BrNp1-15 TaxID=2916754 RepID=UPI001EE80DCD|nr:peptidoglycan-binding domain-containing protein [Flaviramulus sp. BrNp1-15]ULC59633.1 peptidoglycan-binding protein [Flaviramulus sp. BrNp1-15]